LSSHALFAFPIFFFKACPSFAFMCWMPSFCMSLFSFDWLNSSANFAASLIDEFIFGLLLSCLLTIFTNWCLCILCSDILKYLLSLLYMVLQMATGFFILSFSHIVLSVSAFGWCNLYICSTFLVFLSIFHISYNLQLVIPKLYLNTGTAKASIAVILFLEFSSVFSIILNFLVYSLLVFLSLVDVCLHFL
jgi:hypothetical protein